MAATRKGLVTSTDMAQQANCLPKQEVHAAKEDTLPRTEKAA